MKRMKVAQISKPRGDWELVERDVPEPGENEIRIKVEACGVCHSDVLVKEGLWPGLKFLCKAGLQAQRLTRKTPSGSVPFPVFDQ